VGDSTSTGAQKPRRKKKEGRGEEDQAGGGLPAASSRFSSLLELGDE
jgi:hypothetical protein